MGCLALWAERQGLTGYLTLDGVIVEKQFSHLSRWMGWSYSHAHKHDQRR